MITQLADPAVRVSVSARLARMSWRRVKRRLAPVIRKPFTVGPRGSCLLHVTLGGILGARIRPHPVTLPRIPS